MGWGKEVPAWKGEVSIKENTASNRKKKKKAYSFHSRGIGKAPSQVTWKKILKNACTNSILQAGVLDGSRHVKNIKGKKESRERASFPLHTILKVGPTHPIPT